MKILIAGGGIAGLTLSAFLKNDGHDVTLVEQASQWATIGYVITLFPNGLSVFKRLGLDQKIIARGKILSDYSVKDICGRDVWGFPFSELDASLPVVEIERSSLHQTLVEANQNVRIMMGTKIVSLLQDKDGIDVEFTNGVKDRFDIVVGADGINSNVRSFIDAHTRKSYTGFTYWLARIEHFSNMPKGVMIFVGRGKIFSIFPSGFDGQAVVSFGLPAREHSYGDTASSINIIRERFKGSNLVIDEVLGKLSLDSAELFHSDDDEIYERKWFEGRVVLLGDAVHALSPVVGMGASMAMEDAYVLAQELSLHMNFGDAFAIYARRRHSRIAMLQESSFIIHKAIAASAWLGPFSALWFRLFAGPRYKKVLRRLSRIQP